jgi:lactoylglutathione lyase
MKATLLMLTIAAMLPAAEPGRPKITGVAHAAFFVSDIGKARTFYRDLLGYQEPFDLKNNDGSLSLTFIKINDRQYVELFPEKEKGSDRLNHMSIETTDAEAMRTYLASRGVKTPARVAKNRIGNLSFNVTDPDGHTLEITQYLVDGASMKQAGKLAGPERISGRMAHFGILVGALEPAMKFYRDILGFEETWRGTRDPKQLSWVNMKVPDGDDYIEFMLYDQLPEPGKRGSAHHVCLFVPDMDAALAIIEPRSRKTGYARPLEIRTGVNRRRQLNLFDPDGTRVELMEPQTVDGKPAPSSNAPPPR